MRPPFAHRSAVPASFTASPQQRGLNSMDDELSTRGLGALWRLLRISQVMFAPSVKCSMVVRSVQPFATNRSAPYPENSIKYGSRCGRSPDKCIQKYA